MIHELWREISHREEPLKIIWIWWLRRVGRTISLTVMKVSKRYFGTIKSQLHTYIQLQQLCNNYVHVGIEKRFSSKTLKKFFKRFTVKEIVFSVQYIK